MKRGWIGAGMLAALLVLGILAGYTMERRHRPGAGAVNQAAAWALAGDWEKAEALTGQVRAEWEKGIGVTAALTDHEPIEDIESLFAQLEICAAVRDRVAYANGCAQLAAALEAVSEANAFNLRNLL